MNERLDDTQIQNTIRNYQNMIGILKLTGYILILAAVGIVIGLAYDVMIPRQYEIRYSFWVMILFVIIALIIINVIIRNAQKKKCKAFVGTHILRGILADQIELKQYTSEFGYSLSLISSCSVLPRYKKMQGNNYIRGIYRGVELEYCDLVLKQEDDDGYVVVFQGSLLKLPIKKEMRGYIKISKRRSPRRDNGLLSGVMKKVYDMFPINSNEVSIEVGNGIFRMYFDVRTNNSKLAYDFLTPEYIDCISAIDLIFGGVTSFEIKGNSIYIASNNRCDSFEIGKLKTLEEMRELFSSDLDRILAVVDKMKEVEDY